MGERRWRATREAGLTKVPAIVRDTSDDDMLRDALLENLHRAQLNPLEEAAAYRQLLDDFGCTHEQLSERIGRSRPQISNTLRLLKLSPEVQRRVAAGVLSAGHARTLLGVSDPAEQDRLAGRVIAEGDLGARDSRRSSPSEPTIPQPGLEPGSIVRERRVSRSSTIASADRLDTRVKVSLGKSKGKISIEFASLSDLERIVNVIDPRNRTDRPI